LLTSIVPAFVVAPAATETEGIVPVVLLAAVPFATTVYVPAGTLSNEMLPVVGFV
jgi:hypothetical protein